jgi:hypothetical protein
MRFSLWRFWLLFRLFFVFELNNVAHKMLLYGELSKELNAALVLLTISCAAFVEAAQGRAFSS